MMTDLSSNLKEFLSQWMTSNRDLSFKEIVSHMVASDTDKMPVAESMSEARNAVAKNELVAILSTVLGLAASFTFTYFGVKWLVNAMDPTRKEKQEAQARVSS
jgi:hypothetical protein